MKELMNRPYSKPSEPIRLFISSAEEDKKPLEELINRLLPLVEQEKLITLLYPRKKRRGKDLGKEKDEHMEEAQIILLLISAHYMTDKYFLEMSRALAKANSRTARVILILLQQTDWQKPQLKNQMALPMNLLAIESWSDRRAAFADVVAGIRQVIAEVRPHSTSMREPGQKDVEEVVTLLRQQDTSAIVLTGINGSGKSHLATLIRKYVEGPGEAEQEIFHVKPLWLEITPTSSLREIAETVLLHLKKPLPDFEHLLPGALASVLVYALSTADNPCLIILDQFERVLDIQTGKIRQSSRDIEEWLKILNSQQCSCKLLLTGYLFPLIDAPVDFLKEYTVKGLGVAEGMAFLKGEGVTASHGELQEAVVRCKGHPLALKFLASLLLRNKQTGTVRTLLANIPVEYSPDEIAEYLLHTIYQQLNDRQRKLLLAFSICREAVPLDAVQDYMSESRAQIMEALQVLLVQSLLQTKEGRYCPHVVVSRFVLQESNKDQTGWQNRQKAHKDVAHYYEEQQGKFHPSYESRQQKSHIHPLIEAIWHLCQAEEHRAAFDLMRKEVVFSRLEQWNYYTLLRDLCLLLLEGEWQKQFWQEAFIVYRLGQMHAKLGEKQEARERLTRALHLYRQEVKKESGRDTSAEQFKVLNELAGIYKVLQKEPPARGSYAMALNIARQRSDAAGEGMVLNNLGRLDEAFGRRQEASEHYNNALKLFMQIGDHRQQAETKLLLANVSARLGEDKNAERAFEEALELFRQLNDEGGKLETLNRLAEFYLERGQSERAEQYLNEALLQIK